eukprot:1404491-Alexandrium_andersonii.AAC.1
MLLRRKVEQAGVTPENERSQERAFQKAVKLGSFDVSSEKHFQALGGGLLKPAGGVRTVGAGWLTEPFGLAGAA